MLPLSRDFPCLHSLRHTHAMNHVLCSLLEVSGLPCHVVSYPTSAPFIVLIYSQLPYRHVSFILVYHTVVSAVSDIFPLCRWFRFRTLHVTAPVVRRSDAPELELVDLDRDHLNFDDGHLPSLTCMLARG